jgi:hypothetical protein
MKTLINTLLYPFRMVSTIFNHDAHFIVSNKGYEVLNCEHKEWDQDHQIRVIQCRQCGTRAWLRDTKDLFTK